MTLINGLSIFASGTLSRCGAVILKRNVDRISNGWMYVHTIYICMYGQETLREFTRAARSSIALLPSRRYASELCRS